MKYQNTTLMAGIAALSLFAGSGLASAQDSSKAGMHQRRSAARH